MSVLTITLLSDPAFAVSAETTSTTTSSVALTDGLLLSVAVRRNVVCPFPVHETVGVVVVPPLAIEQFVPETLDHA